MNEDYKIRFGYIDGHDDCFIDLCRSVADKKFKTLREISDIVWAEYIFAPIDRDEVILDEFEFVVMDVMGIKIRTELRRR